MFGSVLFVVLAVKTNCGCNSYLQGDNYTAKGLSNTSYCGTSFS